MPILITENLHPGCLIAQLAGSCGLQIIFQLHVHSAIPIGLSTQRVPHDLLWAKTGWHIMKTTVGLDSEDLRLATSTGIYHQNELGQAHWEACFHSIYPSQKAIALRKYNVFESVWWHGLFIFSWDSTGTINHSISLYPSSLSSEVGSWTRFSQLGCLSFFFSPSPLLIDVFRVEKFTGALYSRTTCEVWNVLFLHCPTWSPLDKCGY